jgi:hypothetical protein
MALPPKKLPQYLRTPPGSYLAILGQHLKETCYMFGIFAVPCAFAFALPVLFGNHLPDDSVLVMIVLIGIWAVCCAMGFLGTCRSSFRWKNTGYQLACRRWLNEHAVPRWQLHQDTGDLVHIESACLHSKHQISRFTLPNATGWLIEGCKSHRFADDVDVDVV